MIINVFENLFCLKVRIHNQIHNNIQKSKIGQRPEKIFFTDNIAYNMKKRLTSSLIKGAVIDPNLPKRDPDPKPIFRTTVGKSSLENT